MDFHQYLSSLIEQLSNHPAIWLTGTIGSVLMFVGTIVAVPIVCVRLPADYFTRDIGPRVLWKTALRTACAIVLILAGVAMLVLPGQGMLTILVGVSLLDFPAKRVWQRRILRRPSVLRALNGIRARAGKEPFSV